jgi:tetratricopeptide (TPR) repeat protein
LPRSLDHLQAAELLYETRLFPERELTFKHALTHEVAYRGVLQERRRVLHGRIVEALETFAAERLAEQVDRLAHHAVRGQVWDKAFRYCRQAGGKAYAQSAYREAVECWEQALAALVHLPPDRPIQEQAIDLCCGLSRALASPLAQRERALTHLRTAETLAAALADHRRLAEVHLRMAFIFEYMWDLEPALAYTQRAHAMAIVLEDADIQMRANLNMGRIYFAMGDYRQAMEYFQQLLMASQEERRSPSLDYMGGRRSRLAVAVRSSMVRCLRELGEFATGMVYGAEALQSTEAVDRPDERREVYHDVGYLQVRQGTLHQAIPRLERAVALGQEDTYSLAAASLALAYAQAGRTTDACAMLEQVGTTSGYRGLDCAEAYLRARCVEEAHQRAQRALADARERKTRGIEAWALWLLGESALRRDPLDITQAEAHYQQALALAEALGMRPLQAHCHRGLGTLYAKTGQQEQARTTLAAAVDLYQAMEMTLWLPETEATLAQVDAR